MLGGALDASSYAQGGASMRAPCGTASSDFLNSNAWDFRPLKRCSTVLPAPRPAPAERHPSQFPASGVL